MSLIRIKELAKDSVVYGISSIISKLIVVILVPIYTRIFLPTDYAVINLVNTTFLLVGILSFCALDSAAARWYYDTTDIVDRKKTIGSWFWMQLIITVILASILFAATPLFARYIIRISVDKLRVIWLLSCATLVTNILPSIILNWYRMNRKAKATMLFSISQSVFTIGLTILFVVFWKYHLLGVYLALFISSLLFSLIALLQIYSWVKPRYFALERIKQMLRFSMPMVPAAIAFWLINSASVYFLRFLNGNATEVGIYGVGIMLASAVSLFTGAFQQAWSPFAFSIINEPDAKKTYANVFLTFGVITSCLILFMFLFSPEILIMFTTPNYYSAAWVASIMSINAVLIAYTYIASIGTSIVKNSIYYSIGVIIASVVTVVLYFIFIPLFGKEGAAISTVLAQFIVPLYLFTKAQKLYPIPYKFAHVFFMHIVAIILGIIIRMISFTGQIFSVEVKVGSLMLFLLMLFIYNKKVIKIPVNFKVQASGF